jgi:hypothetical protein
MRQKQRQQLALIYELAAEAGLQLGGSEQELIATWFGIQVACVILMLSASALASRVLAAHLAKSWKRK